MKKYHEPCTTTTDKGQPVSIQWRNKLYQVQAINDRWRLKTAWWFEEQARNYYRVTVRAAYGGQESEMEIYESGGVWVLVSVQD